MGFSLPDRDGKRTSLGEGIDQLPPTKNGEALYRVRYKDAAGKRQSFTRRNLKAAKADQRRILTDIENHTYVDPKLGTITLEEWFKEWIVTRPNKSTQSSYAERYKAYISPHLGHLQLRQIDAEEVSKWLAALTRAGKSLACIKGAHRVLSACLGKYGAAAKRGRMPHGNPCLEVKPQTPPVKEFNIVSEEEFDSQLLPAFTREQDKRMITVAILTGLRFGEMAALKRGDVHLDKREFTISEGVYQVQAVKGYGVKREKVTKAPKGGQPRLIPYVPERALRALKEQLEVVGRDPDDWVFPAPTGGQLNYSNWRKRQWTAGLQKAGLQIRPHDLRHSAATWLVARGVPLAELQALLGHTTPTMTMRYVHTRPERTAAAMRKAWGEQDL